MVDPTLSPPTVQLEMTLEGAPELHETTRMAIRERFGREMVRTVGWADQIIGERNPEGLRAAVASALAKAWNGMDPIPGAFMRLTGTDGHDYTPGAARAPF